MELAEAQFIPSSRGGGEGTTTTKNHFSSKQLSISFSRFYSGNKINRIQNLGQVLCWPKEAGSWQLCLQLPEMLARAGSSEVAGGMCSWLSFAASMYRSSLWLDPVASEQLAQPLLPGIQSRAWHERLLCLQRSCPAPSSPRGVGERFPGLCSLFSQHILLYLKLTFSPPPTNTPPQLVEYIPRSC